MTTQRTQILQMLSDGKISIDETERLLAALDGKSQAEPTAAAEPSSSKAKPKFLHVKVEKGSGSERCGEDVDIKIPIMLLKAGMKFGSLVPSETRDKFTAKLNDKGLDFDLENLDSEKIDLLIKALSESSIDIVTDKEKVRICCL